MTIAAVRHQVLDQSTHGFDIGFVNNRAAVPRPVDQAAASPSMPLRLCGAPHKRNYAECTFMLSPRRRTCGRRG